MIGTIAWWITLFGALNLAVTGIFGKDLLVAQWGGDVMRVIYILVGIAVIWMLLERFGIVKA